MKAQIIQIGNSHGIRIPKTLLQMCHLGRQVELEAREYELIIRSTTTPRQGWKEVFKKLTQYKEGELSNDFSFSNKWDRKEWKWE